MAIADWTVTKRITINPPPSGAPGFPQDPNRLPISFRVDFHFENTLTGKIFDYFEPFVSNPDAKIIDSLAFGQLRQAEAVASLTTSEEPVDLTQFVVVPPAEPTDEEKKLKAYQDADRVYTQALALVEKLKPVATGEEITKLEAEVAAKKALLDAAAKALISVKADAAAVVDDGLLTP